MAKPSIYDKLNDKNAILSVFKDQVNVLRPEDTLSAIGTYNLDGCSCLLALGTTPGSAIVFGRISQFPIGSAGSSLPGTLRTTPHALNYDEHYMSLVRRVINIMTSNHELFQLPVVCAIFSQKGGEVVLEHLKEKTTKVFAHLNIKLRSAFYEISHANGMLPSSGESTVVVVQHSVKTPELYVGNRLQYPASHSGSLASVLDQLGLEQIDQGNESSHGEDHRGNEDEDGG